MLPDKWTLYKKMYFSRAYEEAVMDLWKKGKIYGEMHLGIGEEAIIAGTVLQLHDGDALALDHRGTSPLLIRGCDPVSLMKEFLGYSDGLCGGMGGHMHLFSKDLSAASSGIVGASGPTSLGFALDIDLNRKKNIVLCFFGEGAMNQGMLMESLNLAVVWKLPILFICKDNDMSITTKSTNVTAGIISERAASYGMPAEEIDGSDVDVVWNSAYQAIEYIRSGNGPYFLHAHCVHLQGHFLGDPILRQIRNPIKESLSRTAPLLRSLIQKSGADINVRLKGLRQVSSVFGNTIKEELSNKKDPVSILRSKLWTEKTKIHEIENNIDDHIKVIVKKSLSKEKN